MKINKYNNSNKFFSKCRGRFAGGVCIPNSGIFVQAAARTFRSICTFLILQNYCTDRYCFLTISPFFFGLAFFFNFILVEDTSTFTLTCSKMKCNNLGSTICSKCKSSRYCSRECQAADWIWHQQVCTISSFGKT